MSFQIVVLSSCNNLLINLINPYDLINPLMHNDPKWSDKCCKIFIVSDHFGTLCTKELMFLVLTKDELQHTFTNYDLKRLDLYSKNMVDYHLIMDLLPEGNFFYEQFISIYVSLLEEVCQQILSNYPQNMFPFYPVTFSRGTIKQHEKTMKHISN